jgi:mRNA-degrading endonuclease toxin of MazEF toxin-antitoxin module
MFVLSSANLNSRTGTAIVAAITSGGQFARANGLAIDLAGQRLRTTGIVRCDQIRTLDLDARGARFVESADAETISSVLDQIVSLFDLP